MLKGLRMLDISTWLPGPYCTFLLAEMGAEVIKIEQPGVGDKQREWDSWLFQTLNGNKKSMTLNLKTDSGREIFQRLAVKADVILEGFRPGVVDRLGIDYPTISSINKKIVYCSISGYGQDGPYKHAPGHDINYLGLVGGLSMSGSVSESPEEGHVQGMPVGDLAAGTMAATTILSAYIKSLRTGQGAYIDLSIADLLFSWVAYKSGSYFNKGIIPSPETNGEAHYGVFKTKEGKYVTSGVYEDEFWVNLCQLFGWDDFLNDERFKTYKGRNDHRRDILPRLRQTFQSYERDDLISKAKAYGIPLDPVLNISEAVHHPQIEFRQMLLTLTESGKTGITKVKLPFKIVDSEMGDLTRAPELGEHTEEILIDLGYGSGKIQTLKGEGVI